MTLASDSLRSVVTGQANEVVVSMERKGAVVDQSCNASGALRRDGSAGQLRAASG